MASPNAPSPSVASADADPDGERPPAVASGPDTTPYLLLRVSGVPIEALNLLDSPSLRDATAEVLSARARLHRMQSHLRDTLYDLVPTIEDDDERHAVLDAKRALSSPDTTADLDPSGCRSTLPDDVAGRLDETVELARTWQELHRSFQRTFDAETTTLRNRFRDRIASDTIFQKGLLLSSRSLYENQSGYLDAEPDSLSRGLKSVEESLVSYFCRAAAKTSPFSTFTATAMGGWSDEGSFPLDVGDGRPVSRVRLNRTALRRVLKRLKDDPEVQEALTLSLNGTLEEQDGQFHFYRQSTVERDGTIERSWMKVREAFGRIEATPTLRRICAFLEESPQVQSDLLDYLHSQSGTDRSKIRAYVDALVDQQVLYRQLPFSSLDLNFERKATRWLASLDADLAQSVSQRLSTVLDATEAYAGASLDDREALLDTIDDEMRGLEDRMDLESYGATDIFEDAVIESPEIAAPRRTVDDTLLETLATFASVSSALQQKHQTRQQIAAYFEDTWGAGASVDVLSFFRTYSADRESADMDELLDGADTTSVDAVADYQESLKDVVRTTCRREDDAVFVDPSALQTALDDAPPEIASPRSAAFFAQLGTQPNEQWKVNLPLEGYGKFFSRFAHLFGQDASASLLSALRRQMETAYQNDGVIADVGATFGSNVNLHRTHASYVLNYPGSRVSTDDAHPIDLRSLQIHLDEHGHPQLHSTELDRRVYPFHFGFLVRPWLPNLAKFLLDFSPPKASFIPWHELVFGQEFSDVDADSGALYQPRVQFGDLLVYRDRWHVPAASLPTRAPDDDDSSYFLKIQRWRRAHDLPAESFVVIDNVTSNEVSEEELDQARQRGDRVSRVFKRKPQYVNLTSPLFLRRFEKITDVTNYRLTFEAMFPQPDDSIAQSARGSHASEFVLEMQL